MSTVSSVATDPLPWDGRRLAAQLAASGPTRSWRSAYEEDLVVELATSTPADVAVAATRARVAQVAWAARPLAERQRVLLDFHDVVLDRREELADLLQYEGGKARLTSMEEIVHLAMTARYYARSARQVLHDQRGSGMLPVLTRVDKRRVPVGLVGIIAPWNYPLSPDHLRWAGSSRRRQRGRAQAGPADAVHRAGRGRPAARGRAAATTCGRSSTEPGTRSGPSSIDAATTSASPARPRPAGTSPEQCAERLIGCSLELGGKNPLLVLDDADVDRAADGAVRGCFGNAGQLCVSIERIYVADALHDAFTREFVAKTRTLRLGRSLDYDYEMGSLVGAEQLDRVEAHVEDAGARAPGCSTGGRPRPDLGPLFYEPTVLADVTAEMNCFAEETFGPVVSIYRVGTTTRRSSGRTTPSTV